MAPTENSPLLPVLDQPSRPLRNLRLSVTDRCNLRCSYCMPEEHYTWLPKPKLLSFEEISQVVDAFCDVGVDRLRLTGGEPLLRRDLACLVELACNDGVDNDADGVADCADSDCTIRRFCGDEQCDDTFDKRRFN